MYMVDDMKYDISSLNSELVEEDKREEGEGEGEVEVGGRMGEKFN